VVAQPPRLSLEPVIETDNPPTAVPIAISPWAPLAAIGGAKQVLLYDLTSLELRGVLPFPEGLPRVVRFSRNGRILLAGGGTDALLGKVVLWDIASGERVAEIGDELDTILSADISADHSLVALGGPQKVVRVFRVAPENCCMNVASIRIGLLVCPLAPTVFCWHPPTAAEMCLSGKRIRETNT
jgi:hypothetical protein